MSTSYIEMTEGTYTVINSIFSGSTWLTELREQTKIKFPERAHIQISEDQGQLMQLLVRSTNTKTIKDT